MTAWFEDEVYEEGFYEKLEIRENCRFLIMELQQGNEVMTPLDEVVHDVPNSYREDPCVVVNHLELDYTKPLDRNSNKASSWMNGDLTKKWSYVGKYNMPE
ncbi:hypothetical protein PVK06_019672 [Gossypium arboreum]|uniref:Uncharacterized protein n=1 Tax=Gossypium arboreum TaxID=29729 RepID=A0ABR0PKD0_GOSAR|nr:hypothetical protein PVK06_019672 [Gossypium arboreum]